MRFTKFIINKLYGFNKFEFITSNNLITINFNFNSSNFLLLYIVFLNKIYNININKAIIFTNLLISS